RPEELVHHSVTGVQVLVPAGNTAMQRRSGLGVHHVVKRIATTPGNALGRIAIAHLDPGAVCPCSVTGEVWSNLVRVVVGSRIEQVILHPLPCLKVCTPRRGADWRQVPIWAVDVPTGYVNRLIDAITDTSACGRLSRCRGIRSRVYRFRRVCGPYSVSCGHIRCRRLLVHAEDVAPGVPHVDGAAPVPRQLNESPLGRGSRVHRHGLAVLAPDGERPVVRVKDVDGLAIDLHGAYRDAVPLAALACLR